MLHLTFSNRPQALLEALVADMEQAPAGSPFAAEHVIVPGAAQQRLVTLALADRRGICANVRFSFLAQWLWAQMGHFIEIPGASPFAATTLQWRIRELFDDAAWVTRMGALRSYVEAADPLLRHELAGAIATLFETYVTWRPDWLARWSMDSRVAALSGIAAAERHEPWQATLWARLARDLGVDRQHPSLAFFAAIEARGPEAVGRGGLPERAFLYLLPSVPPLYLQILRRLSAWIDLRLYLLNPCREYWYEIVDRRRLTRLRAAGRADYHEVGNGLLAGWGRQTRATVDLLLGEGGEDAVIDDGRFVASAGTTMLGRLQDAVLDLVELAPGSLAGLADDRSIEVHVAHSLSRQLEALRDQLLALFDAADPPRPSEVLVLVPDLDAAAPLIEAVFGSGGAIRRIPFAITGRGPVATNPVADLLLRLLALPGSRLAADELFDLLQQPQVLRRLRIDDEALAILRRAIRDSGMRWGLDGRHRGTPDDDAFSLRDGLRRLLLSHALAAGDALAAPARRAGAAAQVLMPTGEAIGTNGEAIGRLWAFVEALAVTRATLAEPRPAGDWAPLIHSLLADWLAPDAGLDADGMVWLQEVRTAIDQLDADLATAGARAPIPVAVIRAALAERLAGTARGGVPTGEVTFSTLAAMRGVPTRVLCLLGLDDGIFPRLARPAEFDLMAHAPQRGDRRPGEDDRNLFLDLLLGATDRVQLYFTGRSIRDNAPLPPSVLVADLLDTLAAAIAPAAATTEQRAAARRRLIVEHPLQSFSLSLFRPDDPAYDHRRASHDAETCAAWQAALAGAAAPPPRPAPAAVGDDGDDDGETDEDGRADSPAFFAAALPPPGAEWRRVSLPRLRRFFRHPARTLLRQRLRIGLDDTDDALPNEDRFRLDWQASRQLWAEMPRTADPGIAMALAMRLAPAGPVGEVLLGRELSALADLDARVARLRAAAPRDDHAFAIRLSVDGEDWQVHGLLRELSADGQLAIFAGEAGGKDFLDAWIAHLALNATAPPGILAQTTVLARNGLWRYAPVADAAGVLACLVGCYRRGLSTPLHFYPRTAWSYLEGPRSAAAHVFAGRRAGHRGEGEDPWWQLALRGVADPLDADFAELAATILGPMRAALQELDP